jgi:hypothetical protein
VANQLLLGDCREVALPCETTQIGKPYLVPMTLRKANDFVVEHHRHNGRTARNGGKWAVGVAVDSALVGVAIVGNPLSATLMDGWTAEVLRVCVADGAPKGACSMLYQACWRAWRAMGGRRMITYTLQSESGASLRGANWRIVGQTQPVQKGWRKNDHVNARRTHSPVMLERKNRWQQDDGEEKSPRPSTVCPSPISTDQRTAQRGLALGAAS